MVTNSPPRSGYRGPFPVLGTPQIILDGLIEEFKIISNQILEENAANDPTINKVYQSYKNFHEEVSAYHAISEDAFIEARNN